MAAVHARLKAEDAARALEKENAQLKAELRSALQQRDERTAAFKELEAQVINLELERDAWRKKLAEKLLNDATLEDLRKLQQRAADVAAHEAGRP